MTTKWYHNAFNGDIDSYEVSGELTTFSRGTFLAYGDYLTTGFNSREEAEKWSREWSARTGQEWLWHGTPRENVDSIKREGLKPNKMGFISLTPTFKTAEKYGCVFKVEVTGGRMTQFEGGQEILYWTDKPIPPEKLQHTLGQA